MKGKHMLGYICHAISFIFHPFGKTFSKTHIKFRHEINVLDFCSVINNPISKFYLVIRILDWFRECFISFYCLQVKKKLLIYFVRGGLFRDNAVLPLKKVVKKSNKTGGWMKDFLMKDFLLHKIYF